MIHLRDIDRYRRRSTCGSPCSVGCPEVPRGEIDRDRILIRVRQGWWIATARGIKWWWLIGPVRDVPGTLMKGKSFEQALRSAWSCTAMQR